MFLEKCSFLRKPQVYFLSEFISLSLLPLWALFSCEALDTLNTVLSHEYIIHQ